MKKLTLLLLFLTICALSHAQGILQRDGLAKMDKGAQEMYDGNYITADSLLRQSLGLLSKLPSELAYYFGRNSYHIKKYKQSINWLNKYVELKGTAGQYYDEAALYLDKANEAFRLQREQEIEETTFKLTSDGHYDCPGEYVMCPICHGGGVLIKPGKFGAIYQTCPYSGLSGKLTCDQYNQYLMGEWDTELSDQ